MLTLITSAYFQGLVESFSTGVVIVNTAGEVYVANQAAVHLLDLADTDWLGLSWQAAFAGMDDGEGLRAFMERAFASDRCNTPHGVRFLRRDGGVLHLSLTSSPLVEYEKVFDILILLTDVTALHQLHERERDMLLERSELERERFEGLRLLSQAVAHQLRNPAMTIGGLTRILARKISDDARLQPGLEGIIEAARRLEAIVRSVSEYTALSLGPLSELAPEELLAKARALLPGGGAAVSWDVRLESARLSLDAPLMVTALSEVLRNALEAAAGNDAHIRITGLLDAEAYRLTVEDDGPGIEAALLPFVFDPFFSTKPTSVGMGLTKARRALAEHRGSIALDAVPGTGTRVSLALPVHPAGDLHQAKR